VAKAIVTKEASCDELNAPFSEASLVMALRLLMGLDIQGTRSGANIGLAMISGD